MSLVDPVTVSIIGAGHRGTDAYADFCLRHPDLARVVAVADPDPSRREDLARQHGIAPDRVFDSWQSLLACGRLSDGAVIAMPDRVRRDPVVLAAELGYGLLVEKPVARTPSELEDIVAAVGRSGAPVAVAHVLRYTPFFRRLKELLDSGAVGRMVQYEQTEDIGYWHFAHSYVRGNWHRADEASPMLLAKACHDLDIINWLVDGECTRVTSAGGLAHFTAEHAPPGAPERCTDGCPAAASCPFYAPRLYVERLAHHQSWPVTAITRDTSPDARLRALEQGPYGRCVYHNDNDVADHQQVVMEFDSGVLATLRVSAFTADNTRTVRVLGSHGEIRGRLDTGEIEVRRFLPAPGTALGDTSPWNRDDQGRAALPDDERYTVVAAAEPSPGAHLRESDGHAGGDDGLMRQFVMQLRAAASGTRIELDTNLLDAATAHRIAFAAEASREHGRPVILDPVRA